MEQPGFDMSRRRLAGTVLRIVLIVVFLFVAYGRMPIGDDLSENGIILELLLWLIFVIALLAWQVRATLRAPHPLLRAIESLATSLPLFILLFASAYFVMGQEQVAAFNEPLSRVDAVYFVMTVFATVGFGDIAPVSESARIVVTVQMVLDLILIGVIAKVLFGAVQHRLQVLGRVPGSR
jgi:voltage-gated potassium channel